MPPDPLELFLFLNLLQINSAGKNYAWKGDKIWGPYLKNTSDYALNMKNLQKAYFRYFPRLNVYRFCIHSSKHST